MALDHHTVEERMQRFLEACKEAHAKLTPQRMEIFREVASSEEHPDAELVFTNVRKRLPTVSLDTVYRTLWWLAGLGLVKTLGPSQDRTRFDANLSRHHHFVCIRCGLTRDFYSDSLDSLQLPDAVTAIGSIEQTQVEVKGICHACIAKEQSEAESSEENANMAGGTTRAST